MLNRFGSCRAHTVKDMKLAVGFVLLMVAVGHVRYAPIFYLVNIHNSSQYQ